MSCCKKPLITSEEEELRIILLGMAGRGKSATGNTLLGQNSFATLKSGELIAVTTKCQMETNGDVLVVDTPGLRRDGGDDANVLKDINNYVRLYSPHVFLIVLKGIEDCLEEQDKMVQLLRNNFGRHMWKFAMVLFTNGDELQKKISKGDPLQISKGDPLKTSKGDPLQISKGDPLKTSKGDPLKTSKGDPLKTSKGDPPQTSEGDPLKTLMKTFKETYMAKGSDLHKLVKKCKFGFHLFNNSLCPEDPTWSNQVRELLEKINKKSGKSRGARYTNVMLNKAKEAREWKGCVCRNWLKSPITVAVVAGACGLVGYLAAEGEVTSSIGAFLGFAGGAILILSAAGLVGLYEKVVKWFME